MSNPFGSNQFAKEPQYGDVSKQLQLTREAPISGAPVPGTGTTRKPIAPGAPPPASPGPMATPFVNPPDGLAYYHRVANTWRALANMPGAGDHIAAHASTARSYAAKVEKGEL